MKKSRHRETGFPKVSPQVLCLEQRSVSRDGAEGTELREELMDGHGGGRCYQWSSQASQLMIEDGWKEPSLRLSNRAPVTWLVRGILALGG